MFLDFCNAFNTLPRQGLLNKLAATNPPYWLVTRVHSYCTGRSQYIRAHNKVSSTIPNNCGVLQGAGLSQFLFTLHTSDLFSQSLVSFLKYADDVGRSSGTWADLREKPIRASALMRVKAV